MPDSVVDYIVDSVVQYKKIDRVVLFILSPRTTNPFWSFCIAA